MALLHFDRDTQSHRYLFITSFAVLDLKLWALHCILLSFPLHYITDTDSSRFCVALSRFYLPLPYQRLLIDCLSLCFRTLFN